MNTLFKNNLKNYKKRGKQQPTPKIGMASAVFLDSDFIININQCQWKEAIKKVG